MKTKLILLLLFFSRNVFSQVANVKLSQTFVIHVFMDRNEGILDVDSFIKNTDKVKTIDNIGFNKLVFLSFSVDDLYPENDSLDVDNKKLFSCNYIIAYNKIQNRIYHLKGFKTNDFKEFYIYEVANSLKKKGSGIAKLDDYKAFLSEFKVPGLNLGCLYESVILKGKGGKSGCLISCFQRDKTALVAR